MSSEGRGSPPERTTRPALRVVHGRRSIVAPAAGDAASGRGTPAKARGSHPHLDLHWAQHGLILALLPVLLTGLYLTLGSKQFHWDTLERAYLLEHAGRYMRSWDGSPRSQFLSFAHLFELPLAWLVQKGMHLGSGMQALHVLEALAAGAALALLGSLVRFWGGSLLVALLAQASLGLASAFWKMGSSGEEKILALATQLLFLAVFFRALAPGERSPMPPARATLWTGLVRRRGLWLGASLALAILTHLTAAVLVPFAALAWLVLPRETRARWREILVPLAGGAVAAALLYYAVAIATTHAYRPHDFIDYLTFFHRRSGSNSFELTGAAGTGHMRLERVCYGLVAFFGATRRVGAVSILLAVASLAALAVRVRRTRAPSAGLRPLIPPVTVLRETPGPRLPWAVLWRHAAILASLWSLHFAFYEPDNFESWTLVAALLVLVAAVALPRNRFGWSGVLLPLCLLAGNVRHFRELHVPMLYEGYQRVVDRDTRPGDLVLLVGGIRNGKPLRGSLSMRYFLAHERQRTLVSLYDVLNLTEPEYWGSTYRSPADLQKAIDAGQRAWFPGFLLPDIQRANDSGLLHLTYSSYGDSLYRITHIASE